MTKKLTVKTQGPKRALALPAFFSQTPFVRGGNESLIAAKQNHEKTSKQDAPSEGTNGTVKCAAKVAPRHDQVVSVSFSAFTKKLGGSKDAKPLEVSQDSKISLGNSEKFQCKTIKIQKILPVAATASKKNSYGWRELGAENSEMEQCLSVNLMENSLTNPMERKVP